MADGARVDEAREHAVTTSRSTTDRADSVVLGIDGVVGSVRYQLTAAPWHKDR